MFTVPAVFTAVDKVTAPVIKMQNSIKKLGMTTVNSMKRGSIAFDRFNRRIKAASRGITKAVGTIGLAFGGMLIASTLGNAINVFADFEQANAGLAAVMNVTVKENKALTEDAKRLGATTAKTATEVVGLQEAFARLGFERKAILNMTGATISGSVAMQGELAETAELVGAMVKSFDDFESADAPSIIDKLTASTQKSALNFEKLQTALPIVAGAANSAKVPFTKLLASLGKLSDAGIDASSSSTALRNIFLEAAKRGVPYEKLLLKVKNSTDQLATANQLFGKRGAVAAVILAKNIDKVDELDKSLQMAAGTAGTAAAKQLDTLKGRLTILGSAWEGWILSVESGDGKFGKFLKTTVEVATEFLAMASGTAKLGTELKGNELRIRSLALKVQKFAKILATVLKVYLALVVAQKALTIATRIYQALIKVGKFIRFVGIFIKLAKAKGLATAAQKLLNSAVLANPYVALGVAIAAATVLIWKMVTAQTEAEKVQEDINKRTREIASEQIVNLDKLFREIKKTNTGSKERIELIKQLKQQYPGVNAQMEKELLNNQNLTRSYKFLRDEILRTAKAKAIQEKIGEQANKIVDLELELSQKGVDSEAFLNDIRKVVQKTGGTGIQATQEYQKVLDKFGIDDGIIDNLNLYEKSVKALSSQKIVNDLLKVQEAMNKPAPEFQTTGENISNIQNVSNIQNNQTFRTDGQNVKSVEPKNNRIDLYINNRAGGTIETETEGTGVAVKTTGN